jgi:capsular polysaccharide biosynthesis protein
MEEQRGIQKESTVKDFLEVVFRRKWIIVGIVAVATLSVVFLSLKEPALYESSAKALVRRGEAQGVFNQYVRTLAWEEEIASQIELVKSYVVVQRAKELMPQFYPEGYEPSETIHEGRTNAGVISTSNVIWITYESSDPVFCEAAVNAIVNAYKEYYHRFRTPPEMDDFFESEIRSIKEEIDYWLERKERIYREWDIIDIESQRKNLVLRFDKYREKLDELDQETREKRAIIEHLKKLKEAGPEQMLAASTGFVEGMLEQRVVENLRTQLQKLKVEESKLSERYTDENRELILVRKQIENINGMIVDEIETQIIMRQSQFDVLMNKRSMLAGIIEAMEEESNTYPAKEIEVDRIAASLAQLNENYLSLLESRTNAKMTIASNPEWTVTILSEATPASRKKSRDYVRMALGPVFSIIFALGFAFFIDNLDHSIKNISDAEDSLGLPVLASFPEEKVE